MVGGTNRASQKFQSDFTTETVCVFLIQTNQYKKCEITANTCQLFKEKYVNVYLDELCSNELKYYSLTDSRYKV